jgi:transcriptional regulatory protein RtcR
VPQFEFRHRNWPREGPNFSTRSAKTIAVIGFLGSTLDSGKFGPTRWSKWRPSVSLVMHEDLRVDRFIMLHRGPHARLAEYVSEDIVSVSPETRL